jgi:cytoskeletal protein CcmA (bactofilin family)
MFGNRKRFKTTKIDSLIGRQSELFGDVRFTGGLHVNGIVKGNVLAEDDGSAVLTLSEHGTIEGEVKVPNVILNGVVIGDVHARRHIELAANARITGNVYYSLIEISMGAEVNGNLVHVGEETEVPLKLDHGPSLGIAEKT